MSDSPTPAPTEPATTPGSAGSDRRTLLVVLVIVAVLVAAALVAVFVRGGTAQLDPTTPEGVVQSYATAVLRGDFDSARQLHAESLSASGCDPVSAYVSSDTRLALASTRVSGENAVVTVTISNGYGGPFGSSSGYEDHFELVRQASSGAWFVTVTPWMFQVCIEQGAFE